MNVVFKNATTIKRLPVNIEINLFRIAQESVNNAVKYSKAKSITIKLHEENSNLNLSIQDDGIGFDTNKLGKEGNRINSGNGIFNIKERANIID